MRRPVGKVRRLLRNVAIDLRYGGRFLGGTVPTRLGKVGALDTASSDYLVLHQVFEGRVHPEDVLVDVGCGKGRVINHWLSRGYRNRIVGIELDPDIAERTRRRLRRFANVSIITGDACEVLPREATVIYLYNPFERDVWHRFKATVEERCPDATLLYYYPEHIDPFRDDPRWAVSDVDLRPLLPAGYGAYFLAVITRHRTG